MHVYAPSRLVPTKNRWLCGKPSTCCVLIRDKMLMDAFRLCFISYIIDLLTHAHSRLVTGLLCLSSTSGQIDTFFGFLRFLLFHLFTCVASDPSTLAHTDHWQVFHFKVGSTTLFQHGMRKTFDGFLFL